LDANLLLQMALVAQASSSRGAQKLAAAAQADGARGLQELTAIGAHGLHPANMERDLHRHSAKCLGLSLDLYAVPTIRRKRAGLAAESTTHDILLPHELLGHLWVADRAAFSAALGLDLAEEWWKRLRVAGESWYLQHPLRTQIEHTGGKLHVPVRFFGDEGHAGKTRKVLLLHWSSPLAGLMTRRTRFPIAVLPQELSLGDPTENPLYEAIVWSFNVAASGVYPREDHEGHQNSNDCCVAC
jgi:hypothetical protein